MSAGYKAPTDWRALCEELAELLDAATDSEDLSIRSRKAVIRIRAALAEPVGEGPSDEELLVTLDKATADFPPTHPEAEALNAVEYALALELRKARAVLTRYAHQPAPPADEQMPEAVEPIPLSERKPVPVAWMYRGEPDFDGKKWRENWLVTLDRRLAEYGAGLDKPIPLFTALPLPV